MHEERGVYEGHHQTYVHAIIDRSHVSQKKGKGGDVGAVETRPLAALMAHTPCRVTHSIRLKESDPDILGSHLALDRDPSSGLSNPGTD
jgi:hypothetical protein